MYESIKNFSKQFSYKPKLINKENLKEAKSFLCIGMGGSALAPQILKTWNKNLDITIRHNYGLPKISLEKKMIILSSYSGNTEEVVDAFIEAKEKNLNIVVISTGGKLLSLAKEHNIPYIEMPSENIQPRMALGLSLKAFLKIMGEENTLEELESFGKNFNPILYEEEGKKLAKKLKDYVPIIYASELNTSLAYIWKIKLNETGKIPAFYNIFPELNHNEMTSFDISKNTKHLSEKFYFLVIKDKKDDVRIVKRINTLEKLFKDRDLKIEILETSGENIWQKIFSSIILADFTAYYIALAYDLNPEQVPMVEEFKKLISK